MVVVFCDFRPSTHVFKGLKCRALYSQTNPWNTERQSRARRSHWRHGQPITARSWASPPASANHGARIRITCWVMAFNYYVYINRTKWTAFWVLASALLSTILSPASLGYIVYSVNTAGWQYEASYLRTTLRSCNVSIVVWCVKGRPDCLVGLFFQDSATSLIGPKILHPGYRPKSSLAPP